MPIDIKKFFIFLDSVLRQAVEVIDEGGRGIALIVNAHEVLLGTITDGDIRRALMDGLSLDCLVNKLIERKKEGLYSEPLTAKKETSKADLLKIMHDRVIRQIPILDEKGKVVDLAVLNDLFPDTILPLQAVVMAGGLGKRLDELTKETPKPMLPIGDKPLLERILGNLQNAGIQQVNLSTFYKGEIIEDHFGDGKSLGLDINYVQEDQPLGTAGALNKVKIGREPLLVINGDILTGLDFKTFLDFHKEHKADLTVAVRHYEIQVPYGVLETDGVKVTGLSEKPVIQHFVNAGIYLLNPEIQKLIPKDKFYNMTDLIEKLTKEDAQVIAFPIHEYWLDIGNPEDYEKAKKDVESGYV